MDFGNSDERYQEEMLPQVSRTFALTIPQLPHGLRRGVTNAYLLCRIADTIEDEPALPAEDTFLFLKRFAAVVSGAEDAAALACALEGRFSDRTLPAERNLVSNLERVVRVTWALGAQRAAIERCIGLMCHGMHEFQRTASVRGLARSADLDSYCYYVAGVVGEMLTELFCAHSPAVAAQHEALAELSVSFAQGLQMTNILKDLWEDRSRGACWLPREIFGRHGVELAALTPGRSDELFRAGLTELIGVAHAHLRNALEYTLLVPRSETGIRRFCLWAIGLAVLTLRRIADNPAFTSGAQVKVSRESVMLTKLCTNLAVRNDLMLRGLFELAARGLPLAAPLAVGRAARAAAAARATPDLGAARKSASSWQQPVL
jgi:farnesyl-diphosphate farnesyltransferase